MDAFYKRLIVRAATIDELLSDDFEPLPGQQGDADLAARRLAAWCRSCASGDWSLFSRRLERDGLELSQILMRFATVRRKASASLPEWIGDAIWIEAALQSPAQSARPIVLPEQTEPVAFEHLITPVVDHADALLWSNVDARTQENLNDSARACLRLSLLQELSSLYSPAIYERFVKARNDHVTARGAAKPQDSGTSLYDQFVAEMKAGGFRHLFEDKPVLLRLTAAITRQWIDTSSEFVGRLRADLATIRRDILYSNASSPVAKIEGNISDPHNGGRSVQIVTFADGSRVVYKPKDLNVDVAWHRLIERLNKADPPVDLRAARAIARNGYGWSEFIDHSGCADQEDCKRFFRRAGAWLALFHCFVANDLQQEDMIAAGDHPVPIDLETILQASAGQRTTTDPEAQAFDVAVETLANSVMMVGLLPAYVRSPDNSVFAIGGMTADWNSRTLLKWNNINSDEMRPAKSKEGGKINPNLPHIDGHYAKFGDYIDDFISGFEHYAKFLLHHSLDANLREIFDGFDGLPVRKVIRPTRFYYMLLQRLKNHRTMDDGVAWSAQADFIARLADWENPSDPTWQLQRPERSALIELNVPHFTSPCDGNEICDATGFSIRAEAISGMDRAQARVQRLDEQEIAWQIEVIRQITNSNSTPALPTVAAAVKSTPRPDVAVAPTRKIYIAEADRIAGDLSHRAIRRGPGAAWIGLDWLGDAEVFQLVCLGSDLYNGASGIAVFLAAHAAVTQNTASGELALAGVARLRKNLKRRDAARLARSLGIGGATGLGSIVYALTVMAKCLDDAELLADAHIAADLFTDDLIAADKQLDVIGGSAGAILSLLRLYRDSQSVDVLRRATKCGEHLLAQSRLGPEGRRSWVGQGSGLQALNGMSHGAAGFAYALTSLSAETGREEYRQAALECIAFENASYDAERSNWPDFRSGAASSWPCQWCHGAPGIGLARTATARRGGIDAETLAMDIQKAVEGTKRGLPSVVDTLCCGTLGRIEFLCEAGSALERSDLRELASRQLITVLDAKASTGDYRWNSGKTQFNLGLFRGLAGVGYTLLRQVDRSLPNVLIWE